jgi:hypothetical protein
MAQLYGWLVVLSRSPSQNLTRNLVTHQPAYDAVGAVMSALEFNPEFTPSSVLRVERMRPIEDGS